MDEEFRPSIISQIMTEIKTGNTKNPILKKIHDVFIDEDGEKNRGALLVLAVIILLLCMMLSGYTVAFQRELKNGTLFGKNGMSKYNIFMYLLLGVLSKEGIVRTPLIFGILLVVFYFISKSGSELSTTKSTDERGVNYSTVGTYGTAEWMTEKAARECYEVAPIEETRGIILAQYDSEGRKCISLPAKRGDNNNIAIFGSPGTGKSFCFVRNAAYQAIKRGESVVLPDPKGELYESTASIFKANGYEVYVFNLLDPERSDAWNCAGEIFDPQTGNVSEIRVAEFADILMKNTSEGKEDGFWGPGEQNLLKAVVFYCAYMHEVTLSHQYKLALEILLSKIVISDTDADRLREIVNDEYSFMIDKENAIRFAATKLYEANDEKDIKKSVDEYIKKLKSEAAPCTIAQIYYELIKNDLDAFGRKFDQIPVSHPASIAWGIFKNSSDKTQPGFMTGAAQRLQLFQMRSIRRITSNEDIVLSRVGEKKTAIFVIISDKSAAMRAVTSLFFNFLFKDVSDAVDKYGSDKRIPVNVICDEFANLGALPQFQIVISTVRSRMINLSIILQSTTQLNQVYGEENANTIIACCDTILFIGCNDLETASFISELSGVASIRVTSIKDSQTAFGARGVMQGYSTSDGDGKRYLVNPDEVRRLPKEQVLVYHRGQNMLKANRCGYVLHPYYEAHFAKNAPSPLELLHLRDYDLASQKYSINERTDAFVAANAGANQSENNEDVISKLQSEKSKETKREQIQRNEDSGMRTIIKQPKLNPNSGSGIELENTIAELKREQEEASKEEQKSERDRKKEHSRIGEQKVRNQMPQPRQNNTSTSTRVSQNTKFGNKFG